MSSRRQVQGKLQRRSKRKSGLIEQKAAVRLILRGERGTIQDRPNWVHPCPHPMPRSMSVGVLQAAGCHAAYQAAPRWAKRLVLKELDDSHNCSWTNCLGKHS